MKKLFSLLFLFAIALGARAELLSAGMNVVRTNRQQVSSIWFTNSTGSNVVVGVFDGTNHCSFVTNQTRLAVAPIGETPAPENRVEMRSAPMLTRFTIPTNSTAVFYPDQKFYFGILITNSGAIGINIQPAL